ncbi:WD40 repeat domain-containing protein [Adhaeribacter soli]|uniref:T9SS type A sorting domain-containing protein n=1 Tax=Adhaeribacter soli TaxID=2607655 RepID=A0A5N1J3W2_9BACT|nr:hypothetical protein [Adhaeribacter soli]KAA9345586.1 hypothetical protein F0P94_00415 [Adhaeribacter soli]
MPLFAQTPTLAWQQLYGNSTDREYGNASIRLNSNLYVHGGYLWPPSPSIVNTYAVFTDGNGTFLRDKLFPDLNAGKITGMAANDDGTFVACGSYQDSVGAWAVFIFKADQLGNIQWRRSFTGDMGNSQRVVRVPDGYLIITSNQVRIIKTDLNGRFIWKKVYGQDCGGESITPLPDGSYLATGWSTRGGASTVSTFYKLSYWLLKLRPNGDTIYTRIIGTPTNYEVGHAAANTQDGGVAVAGAYVANVPNTKRQGQVLKLDSLLNLQWEMKVMPNGGSYSVGCEFFAIQPTVSGDYVVAGQNFRNTYNEAFMARITPPTTLGGNAGLNWSSYFTGGAFIREILFENDGSAMVGGTGYIGPVSSANMQVLALKLINTDQPYRPDFCATPPQAYFTTQLRPDSLILLGGSASQSGLRYGVISKWEYQFGDGSRFITYQPSAAKRVAHKYNQPAQLLFGTAVKLIVTNNLFCTDTLTLYPFGGGPTGISEATAQQVEVKLFSQPLQQRATLELKNYRGKARLQLEFTDLLGRKVTVLHRQEKPGLWQLEKGNLSKGLYLYRVVSPSSVVAQGKLVVH